MRFKRVIAVRFGPLLNDTLEFKPGMNVIYGRNETGKSSWHGAIYASLCGMRRGAGRPKQEDQNFSDRHRPWDGKGWEVRAEIEIDDGRKIELQHDLEHNVDSRATDMDLGRDLSDEIMNDNAPDGSVWLGLDRRAFLATACVRQAEVLGIRDDPDLLQKHLQRAAATAGTDETAAQAIKRLKEYHSEHVGLDRSNSTKPLRTAMNEVDRLKTRLEEVRQRHERFAALVQKAEASKLAAREAGGELLAARADTTLKEAEDAEKNLSHVRKLLLRFPEGKEPSREEDEELAQEVRAALLAWRGRPELETLEGKTVAELEMDLARVPEVPGGDLRPTPETERAHRVWIEAGARLGEIKESTPSPVERPRISLREGELRDIAHALEVPVPQVDADLEETVKTLERRLGRPWTSGDMTAASAGALILILGLLGVITGYLQPVFSILAIGIGVGSLAIAWYRSSARARKTTELTSLRRDLDRQVEAREAANARHAEAERKAREEGLSLDPDEIRSVADAFADAVRRQKELADWNERLEKARKEASDAGDDLSRLLSQRGTDAGEDLDESWASYEAACSSRDLQAKKAGKRPEIETKLEARRASEARRESDEKKIECAKAALISASTKCGIGRVEDPEELYSALENWLKRRDAELSKYDEQIGAWKELQNLLDGRAVGDLEKVTRERRRKAGELEAELQRTGLEPEPGDVEKLQEESTRALRVASQAQGVLENESKSLPDLGEAETNLAEAERELERVRRLERTLQLTLEYLEGAQERVQRDMAPRISEIVEKWLPQVTGGRYEDVRVDPDNLEVRVRDHGGAWRSASQLSHGTQEQIYLLLRVAMTRLLVRNEEMCPLLFDDVTVHSDDNRTRGFLDLLHHVSEDRQVIVFTQENEVLDWAEESLNDRDQLVQLSDVPVSTGK